MGRDVVACIFKVRQKWSGHFVDSDGASGDLGILWNPLAVHVEVVSSSKYWQMVKVISKTMNFSCFLVNVYGPTLVIEKCKLWEDVSRSLEEVRPLLAIMARDFNATLSSSEKHGGVRRLSRSHLDFQSFVNDNVFLEVVAKGGDFTWTNRHRGISNIAEKLDRFFLARDWSVASIVFEAKVLAISREVFGNIFDEKRRLESELGALNAKVMADGMDEVDSLTEKDLLSRYGEFLQSEEIYWKQKSWVNWLREGDINTKLFHSSVKARRSLNRILSLRLEDSSIIEDPDSIVSREDNSMLEEPVSLKEVKVVVFGLGGEKAPGLDGFQAFFFQSFWEVLGEELLAMVEESRSRGFVLKEFNCTMVVLIPKKAKPAGMEEFHPISLCNTI
ncbi:uncharacterized protein LOC131863796 [Cryptomeria japonica]|uniref:uncharacterized protein LOC131863796 n=1 Tax=Cryptomeria japonica TaxID=3369 RepID=UPI0027DA50D1|nr:uncharacterized protein LOC131863796 [Cryptomeria japonica]